MDRRRAVATAFGVALTIAAAGAAVGANVRLLDAAGQDGSPVGQLDAVVGTVPARPGASVPAVPIAQPSATTSDDPAPTFDEIAPASDDTAPVPEPTYERGAHDRDHDVDDD